MRVIKLTHGAGNGIDKACLMTASNMLIGKGEDGDDNSCVCPVIRGFIIPTNDAIPESILGELYGPLAWEILGTRSDDINVMRERAFVAVRWFFEKVLPGLLDHIGLNQHAEIIRNLKRIDSQDTASDAARAARAARAASYAASAASYAASYAASAASYAASAASYAASAASAASDAASYAASDAASAASAASYAASAASDAASAASAASAAFSVPWETCPDVIREMAAIGDARPVECVINKEQLCNSLGAND